MVDRPNIGLRLDIFQRAGGEWGDPTTESCIIEDEPRDVVQKEFKDNMNKLGETVPKENIYLLQISDACKPLKPFSKDLDERGLPRRGRWSHDYRPLPYNCGYLPIVDVTRAMLRSGFRGCFSYEVFDSGPGGKRTD